VCGLHEQCSHVFVATFGDLAQDRAIPCRLLLHRRRIRNNIVLAFQGARDRTCRAYAKIVQLYQSRTRSSAAATAFLSPHFRFQDLTQYQE
jgi:hypothetical protein